jgi:hypothetical protein
MKPTQQNSPAGLGDHARTKKDVSTKATAEKTEQAFREIDTQVHKVGPVLEEILHHAHVEPHGGLNE